MAIPHLPAVCGHPRRFAMMALFLLVAAPVAAQDSTFLLVADEPTSEHPAALGNGRFSMLTSPRGVSPTYSFLAGLYERARGDVPRVAALPAWNAIDFFNGDSWLGGAPLTDSVLRSYRQTVDMYDGTVHTSYDWVDGGRRTSVQVHAFVSRADPSLAAVRLELTPHYAGRVRASFTLRPWPAPRRLALAEIVRLDSTLKNADLWYPGQMMARSRHAERRSGGGLLSMTSSPEGGGATVAQAVAAIWPATLRNATARTDTLNSTMAIDVAFDASSGVTYTFDKVVSIESSQDAPDPLPRAFRAVERGRARGFDALSRDHVDAWHALWRTDIRIEGDPELQRTVHAMLFHLLNSGPVRTGWSIPPMGLTSAGYYGHVFWDADTWMFPALLLSHPDIARSMVMFRFRTLDAAKRNARANGFRGAMYPWEADDRGEETTPRFASQNAHSEVHITGDVGVAQWQYYQATGDSAYLARYGYPVIRETAEFWVSRAVCGTARCDIRDVVSVDEGMVGVSNDAYTNAVARKNLLAAVAASRALGQQPSPQWEQVATRLYIPFDSAGEYHRTYERAPPATLGSVVPLLAYPLTLPMSERAKRTDLDNAVRRLANEGPGAMMTATLYPVVAAELRDRALVDSLLPLTHRDYLRGPFRILAETPKNDAVNFLTGAGGFLQQVIYGYTGLRLSDDGVRPAFAPVLPSTISRLTLRGFRVRGKCYDIVVEKDQLRMNPHADQRASPGPAMPTATSPC
jgi:trehalose/maltose hydrolase-like predicted phosphorylase